MMRRMGAVGVALLLGTSTAYAKDAENDPFSEIASRKRVAFTLIGAGGTVTAIGGLFFFVGRGGASLHLNSDGSLRSNANAEEALAAANVQRVALGVAAVGVALVIAGSVVLFTAARRRVSIAPTFFSQGVGVSFFASLD